MTRRTITVFALSLFLFGTLTATLHAELQPKAREYLDRLPVEVVEQLNQDGRVRRDFDNHRDLQFLPDYPMARQIDRSVNSVRPNVMSEALMYLDHGISDEEYLSLYNAFREVSELSYLEYYNPEKERWNELFYQSYHIPGPETNEPLPDPVVPQVRGSDSFYVGQEIPPFGYIASEYEFLAEGEAFLFSSENLDRFYYNDIPVLAPGNMITHVLLIRGDDFVLAYGVGGAKVFTLFGILSGRIETPFQARTSALFDWFYDKQLMSLTDSE